MEDVSNVEPFSFEHHPASALIDFNEISTYQKIIVRSVRQFLGIHEGSEHRESCEICVEDQVLTDYEGKL